MSEGGEERGKEAERNGEIETEPPPLAYHSPSLDILYCNGWMKSSSVLLGGQLQERVVLCSSPTSVSAAPSMGPATKQVPSHCLLTARVNYE